MTFLFNIDDTGKCCSYLVEAENEEEAKRKVLHKLVDTMDLWEDFTSNYYNTWLCLNELDKL